MRENYTYALQQVLKHEGGYVDHPNDPGGATNFGVTLSVYRQHYGPHQTKETLRHITDEQVAFIYQEGYWNRCRCDMLPSGVDYVVFDQAVNSGPFQSIKWLQKATGVTPDGQLGPITLRWVEQSDASSLIQAMCRLRLSVLERLRNGDLWRTFGKGWKRRVTEVESAGIRLATDTVQG